MGWLWKYDSTRKSIIEDITKGWERDGKGVRYIAKQFKGAPFKGILYAVGQPYTILAEGRLEKSEDRFIIVCLLEYWKRDGREGWAYKDMEECDHPYYYSCPKKYVAMTPTVTCAEWRTAVAEYHVKQAVKRKAYADERKRLRLLYAS